MIDICTYRFRPVPVIVTRGSAERTGAGRLREVTGVAIKYLPAPPAWQVRLTQYDPDAMGYCAGFGDVGWWDASSVRVA